MYHGHDPRAIRDYPWRDVRRFVDALPRLRAAESPFADAGGDQ